MAVTIDDLAKHVNMSRTTVWRVLNNEPYVKEETRIAVLKGIKELNYQPAVPNLFNNSSNLGISKNIGFYVDSSLSRLSYDPFYSKVLNGVCVECEKNGYRVTYLMKNGKSDEEVMHMIDCSNLCAVIGLEITKDLSSKLARKGIPLVIINEYIKGEDIPTILMDDFGGARRAVEYLISLGHRQIAFLGGQYSSRQIIPNSLKERQAGYEFALKEKGISIDEDFVAMGDLEVEPPGIKAGYIAAKDLLSNDRIDAIFAASDLLAIGVTHYAHEIGLIIPKDLSLIGFDNIHSSEHLVPPLTTVNVPKEKMGMLAVKRCIDLIENKASVSDEEGFITRVSTKLIIRQSCV